MSIFAKICAAFGPGALKARRLARAQRVLEEERLATVAFLNDARGGDWYYSHADEHGGDWYADAMTDREVHVRVVE